MKHRAGATHVAFTTQRDSLLADAVQAARTGPAIAAPLLQRMTQEIFKYHREVVPDGQNRAQRERSRLALELICRELWPNAVIHVFGSVASTLYLRDSDIDFTVALPEADMQVLRNTAEPAAPPSRRRNRKSATAAAATTTGGDTPAAPAVASSSSSTTSSALSKAAELHDVSWVPPDSETHNLFVTNLPFTASADDVLSIFEPCGAGGVFLPMRAGTTQMKGLGFLLMPTKQSASDAISAMNGVVLGGRPLRVSLAKYGFSTELAQPGFLVRAHNTIFFDEKRAAAAASAASTSATTATEHNDDDDDGDDDDDDDEDDLPEEEWTAEDARRRGGDVLALTKLFQLLRKDRALGQFKLIDMARIPIIQRHVRGPSTLGSWPFDLTINRLLGVYNSALIRHFVLADARFAPLALLVKAWAGRLGVNSSQHGYLSSYALYLMLIFYLQTRAPPVLPNLCAGRSTGGSVLIDGYNCYFDREAQPPSKNTLTHSELLIGFFRFYATEFDYENEVVCVRRAARTTKADLQTELTALIEDARYPSMQLKRYSLVSNWKKEMLAVEDPFENNFNPARHLQDHRFAYVVRCFKSTFVALVAQPTLATLNIH
jgi:RNA recognition motif-containing protein